MENDDVSAWPVEWTEEVNICPLCNSDSVCNHENRLIDWLSVPPSGYWRMNVCGSCGVGYLSLRPAVKYIQNAYKNYYTHSKNKGSLINKYLRGMQKYLYEAFCDHAGHNYTVSGYLVYALVRIVFPLGLYFDTKSRHIFKFRNTGRLLDVGCGNGEFLEMASRHGWEVIGVDFDQAAVSVAKSRGLIILHGGIDVIDSNEKFDFISLNHVIEHVYDPLKLIQSCYALLNDGGTLWLETPNIDSIGYALYKSNWRGLEPPRHIMLFNKAALSEMLLKSGFVSVEQKSHGLSGVYMGLSSEGLLNKTVSCSSMACFGLRKIIMLLRVISLELIQLLCKKRKELLTLVATR